MRVTNNPAEQGTAMIEFALSAIVLFTLIFGCIVMVLAFYSYEVINQYARDASRYAMVHGIGCNSPANGACSIGTGSSANSKLKSYLNHQIFPGINGNQLIVSTAYTHAPGINSCFAVGCNGAGDQVAVTVSYPYLYAVPFIPGRAFILRSTSTMIISQ